MSKTKHRKPDEFHLETIRAQSKEIKQLKQEIGRLNKLLNYNQNRVTIKELKKVVKNPDCISCGKGFLKEVIILDRKFKICNICEFRSKATKYEKN